MIQVLKIVYGLFFVVDLQSWERKIAEEKEQEYDNEENIEVEENITVSCF